MAGTPDFRKRNEIRKKLKFKKYQEMSDREFARVEKCSKALVKAVRSELIASGVHPNDRTRSDGSPAYQPGASVRGGYVWDDHGKAVRDVVWKARQRQARQR